MRHFKDKVVTFLVVVPFAIFVLTPIIFFDVFRLPTPIMKTFKVIWSMLVIALAIFLRLRFWEFKPRSMKGRFGGLNWVANITYDKERRAVDTEIHWLCPKHKVFLNQKGLEMPGVCHHTLFCTKCNQIYDLKVKNETIYIEEAQMVIKQDILSEVES